VLFFHVRLELGNFRTSPLIPVTWAEGVDLGPYLFFALFSIYWAGNGTGSDSAVRFTVVSFLISISLTTGPFIYAAPTSPSDGIGSPDG